MATDSAVIMSSADCAQSMLDLTRLVYPGYDGQKPRLAVLVHALVNWHIPSAVVDWACTAVDDRHITDAFISANGDILIDIAQGLVSLADAHSIKNAVTVALCLAQTYCRLARAWPIELHDKFFEFIKRVSESGIVDTQGIIDAIREITGVAAPDIAAAYAKMPLHMMAHRPYTDLVPMLTFVAHIQQYCPADASWNADLCEILYTFVPGRELTANEEDALACVLAPCFLRDGPVNCAMLRLMSKVARGVRNTTMMYTLLRALVPITGIESLEISAFYATKAIVDAAKVCGFNTGEYGSRVAAVNSDLENAVSVAVKGAASDYESTLDIPVDFPPKRICT